MKGEEPICSGCGFPIHTNEHSSNCSVRNEQISQEQQDVDPYGPEAIRLDIQRKAEILRDWASRLGLEEGKDLLIIESMDEFVGDDYQVAPHEAKSFAVGVLEPHYKAFREYILGEYKQQRKKENPKGDVQLYYSWGGRFLVGWDGVPFDTVAMESVDPPRVPTHHEEFKHFFKDRYGFEFPTSEVLNPLLTQMSREGLSTYEEALSKLKVQREEGTLPSEGYGMIDSLEHASMILKDAASGEALMDLPEMVEGAMKDKMAHYADLTYNAGSVADYDKVAELSGVKFPDEIRLDKLFSKWNFDRNQMEAVCHEFADYLEEQAS